MNRHEANGRCAPLGAPPAQALRRRRGDERPGDELPGRLVRPGARPSASAPAPATRRWSPSSRGLRAQRPDTGESTPRYSSVAQPWVFVQDRSGAPCAMAHPAVVRQWLRKGKARMHRFGPPVARLLCPHAEACLLRHWGRGSVDVGLDPGSETGGIAVVRNDVLIWCAEATRSTTAGRVWRRERQGSGTMPGRAHKARPRQSPRSGTNSALNGQFESYTQ